MLLSAPRRSSASPNSAGNLAVFTVGTYSFETHKKTSEIKVLDISTGQSTLITNEEKTSEPNWLGESNELLWLRSGEKGVTHLIIGSADEAGQSYTAATVPAPISDVKLKALGEATIAIAVTGKALPDGSLYNPENEVKAYTTGKVYDNLMVRHWDKYVTPNKNAIWHGILQRAKPHITESRGRFSLGNLTNILLGSGLESPMPPWGGKDHFDLGTKSIGFVAKDPSLNPALNTKSNLYVVTIDGSNYSKPKKIEVENLEGASTAPAFSPDGTGVAFLQMKENGYESDKNRIILCVDLSKPSATFEVLKSDDGTGQWDRSPHSITWSNDGKALFLVAEDKGISRLYKLMVPYGLGFDEFPEPLTQSSSVGNVQTLGKDSSHLFLSSSNLIDNSIYSVLDPTGSATARTISSNSRNGSFFGLSQNQVFDIWFQGAQEQVHAWVMKPSNFNSDRTYPLAYLIHGGPQGAWTDSWSTRWNPAVFAEQGYVVIAPNPTGSTSYGQAFTDAITESWGGLPYEDLVKGFEYIKSNMDYVDTHRAVALGASYGGYMMNWMQGHALGKEFKGEHFRLFWLNHQVDKVHSALVCHDGLFNMVNQLSTDEQYFLNHDLGGPYYTKSGETWKEWDPAQFTANWSTPMLVIHSELDYRLSISEGLAMFNLLQEKGIPSRFLTFPDEYARPPSLRLA